MKITCPYCDNKFSFEEAVRVKISRDLGETLQKFGNHKFLAWEYAGAFATKRFGPISAAKRLRILTELFRLWESGIFQIDGKRYKIDRAGIVAGMTTVCNLEKYGLSNHNYLKKVLLDKAERVSAEGLTAREETRREEEKKVSRLEDHGKEEVLSPEGLKQFREKMGVNKLSELIGKKHDG